ncbi:PilZ domain-containing protein [Sphingobium sp.]|uniref:PilZ domain-containing protein n=1 Tax=Sphingobium sp. TaxID=1912891 RepID=UPI002BE791AE|nr:PilZ domain-containing protein [Sphingobium sp.]HUD95490.1 PilZ domain-containing protein [Sphingobium sp.]
MVLVEQSGNGPDAAPDRSLAPRESRVTTLLLIGKLRSHHGESLCRIRNLSSGGLMAEVHVPLTEGDPVEIELKAGDRLSGEVRWVMAGRMGIAFDNPVEVGNVLARAAIRSSEQGLVRAPRFAAECPVDLRGDGRRHTGQLVNVSQGGARLHVDMELEQDQLLTLSVPGLPDRMGGVRWARDAALGLAFVEPLSFDELGIWLAQRRLRT